MDWNPELALLDTIQPRMFIVRCDCGPRRSDYALLLFFAYEIVILMNCGRLPFEIENVLGRFPVPRLFYFSLSASFFLRPAPFDENCVDWGGGIRLVFSWISLAPKFESAILAAAAADVATTTLPRRPYY